MKQRDDNNPMDPKLAKLIRGMTPQQLLTLAKVMEVFAKLLDIAAEGRQGRRVPRAHVTPAECAKFNNISIRRL